MQEEKLVSIIIINWNGREYLNRCLSSLQKMSYSNYEIIIVDNNSNDGSTELIKESYPQIKLIRNTENLGFAEANNIGYEHAKGDYILLLNNDTIVEEDFLDSLISALEKDSSIGCVQPRMHLMNEPDRLDTVGSFLLQTGFLYHYGFCKRYDKLKHGQTAEIYSAKGACMLIKREIIEITGLFDKVFFAYFEETDLCHRIWLAGYRIVYVPNSVIHHKMAATMEKLDYSFVVYHSFKNRICSHLKNLGWMELIKILPLHLLTCEIGAIIYLLARRTEFFVAIQKAIWWNILNIRLTLKKRKEVQTNIRKIPDREFMRKIKRNVSFSYYYYLFLGLDKIEINEFQ